MKPQTHISASEAIALAVLLLAGCPSPELPAPTEMDVWCTAPAPPPEALRKMGQQEDGSWVLPGNRRLTPAGLQAVVGGFPVDVLVHPSEPVAYVSNTGYAIRRLQVVDLATGLLLQEIDRPEAFYGLALDADGARLYASGGESNLVEAYDVGDGGLLTHAGQVAVDAYPAGLALSADGDRLWVAQFSGNAVVEVDPQTLEVTGEIAVGVPAYAVVEVPGRGELYVSGFGGTELAVVDTDAGTLAATIEVGGNPQGLAVSPDGAVVYATVTEADVVIKVDTATRAVVASQPVGEATIVGPDDRPLPASSPTGLALDPGSGWLLAVRAADNAVAVLDADTLAPQGAIPVGWYPTAVALAGDGATMVACNGKGIGSGPLDETGLYAEGGKSQMTGTLSLIDLDALDLRAATAEVEANVRRPDEVYRFGCYKQFPVPGHPGGATPIEHIVLIVRENKTYDTVLGDLETGDGEPEFALYGEEITPNLHALARRFTSHDNFYNDSECSVQGHLWLTSSFVNDYMERVWLEQYRGNAGWDAESVLPQGQPDFGTFFTHLITHDVDFTIYGEVVGAFGSVGDEPVMDHIDLEYPGGFYNMDIKDEAKANYVVQQLVDEGEFPPFVFVLIPNDHTYGYSGGRPTPESMINDNDVATGIIVDGISHSEYWDRTAIFVVEDDPQIGSDHIDYHRSILIVASPWARRGHTSSVHTSFPSLFRTFELILDVPPMNRYDALATPLWDAFTHVPDPEPYDHIGRTVPDAVNPSGGRGDELCKGMDFSGPDRNPHLGAILWYVARGTPPPGSSLASALMEGDTEAMLELTWDAEEREEAEEWDEAVERVKDWLADHPEVPADPALREGR